MIRARIRFRGREWEEDFQGSSPPPIIRVLTRPPQELRAQDRPVGDLRAERATVEHVRTIRWRERDHRGVLVDVHPPIFEYEEPEPRVYRLLEPAQ